MITEVSSAGINIEVKTFGANGKSAYDIAVLYGFVGTESQWLASLGGSAAVVYQYQLQAADITTKGITLLEEPADNDLVSVVVAGGVPQVNGTDFSVSGFALTWSLLGYQSLAEAGDILIITYQK